MGFERCHPAVNFLFFSAVLWAAAALDHPLYTAVSLLCALLYACKRSGKKMLLLAGILLLLAALFALYYSSYTHFGVTVLEYNPIGNRMTLESLLYGASLGLRLTSIALWLSCVFSVFTTDKVVYLFGTVSPHLSLFLAILLRMIPRIKTECRTIHTAQKGIGRGVHQGRLPARIRNVFRMFSVLITWTIDALTSASDSMRSRGSTLPKRTAYSLYRFDNRDRAYTLVMVLLITLTAVAAASGQADMRFDPILSVKAFTPLSLGFGISYLLLGLMPLLLECWTEYRFTRARNARFETK